MRKPLKFMFLLEKSFYVTIKDEIFKFKTTLFILHKIKRFIWIKNYVRWRLIIMVDNSSCPICGSINVQPRHSSKGGIYFVCTNCGCNFWPSSPPHDAEKDTVGALKHQICAKCGAKMPVDAKFCGFCGASLKTLENKKLLPIWELFEPGAFIGYDQFDEDGLLSSKYWTIQKLRIK
jgi:ribosomal protein L40E